MKRILVVMILSCLMLSSFVYGEEQIVDSTVIEMIVQEVELTNERIDYYIDVHIDYSEVVLESYNEEIEFLNENFSAKTKQHFIQIASEKKDDLIDQIIDSLIAITNAEAERMFERAESFGVPVICDYILVTIDQNEVQIDPIRVVGG